MLVKFTQPQSAVGTYSYEIVAGTIRDAVRSNPIVQVVNPSQTFTETAQGNQIGLPIPTQGSGGTGTAQDITTSTLDVNDVPVGAVINTITVTLQINHTSDSDLIITLFAPDGTPVTLANQRGGTGDNFLTTTFTDAAATQIRFGTAPFNGSFRPDQALNNTLRNHTAFGLWTLQIEDTQGGDVGTLQNWSMVIQTGGVTSQPTSQSGNLMDQNVNGTPGEAGDFYATPTPLGTGAAFTAPYAPNTLPLIIPGPHLVGTRAVLTGGTLAPITTDNLVTDKTVSGLDVTFDRDMNAASFTAAKVLQIIGPAGPITGLITVAVSPANANPSHIRTFRISFPTQQLSGTYTLTLDSGIQSAAGDKLDTNLNAGVDVLRGISPTGATTPIATPSNDTPIAILPLKTITSNITISDNFPIQGATLTLNINYPNDPDLEATLIALDPAVTRPTTS